MVCVLSFLGMRVCVYVCVCVCMHVVLPLRACVCECVFVHVCVLKGGDSCPHLSFCIEMVKLNKLLRG